MCKLEDIMLRRIPTASSCHWCAYRLCALDGHPQIELGALLCAHVAHVHQHGRGAAASGTPGGGLAAVGQAGDVGGAAGRARGLVPHKRYHQIGGGVLQDSTVQQKRQWYIL